MNRTVTPGIAAVWLLVLGCLSLTIFDNLRLRGKLAELSGEVTRSHEVPVGPAPGKITANDPRPGGMAVSEGFGEQATVVLVASFSCVFCKNGMPAWRELAAGLPTARFVLLRTDIRPGGGSTVRADKYGPTAFAFPARRDLHWLVPSEATVAAYRLGNVPQTIVERGGRVLYVRTGALTSEDVANIRRVVL